MRLMTSSPNPHSSPTRPLRLRRPGTLIAGVMLAGVGFVAAQAGPRDFMRIELEHLMSLGKEQAAPIHVSVGGEPRSYSRGSPDRGPDSNGASANRLAGARTAGLTLADLKTGDEG